MIMHHPTQITTQLKYLLTAVHCQFKGNSLWKLVTKSPGSSLCVVESLYSIVTDPPAWWPACFFPRAFVTCVSHGKKFIGGNMVGQVDPRVTTVIAAVQVLAQSSTQDGSVKENPGKAMAFNWPKRLLINLTLSFWDAKETRQILFYHSHSKKKYLNKSDTYTCLI